LEAAKAGTSPSRFSTACLANTYVPHLLFRRSNEVSRRGMVDGGEYVARADTAAIRYYPPSTAYFLESRFASSRNRCLSDRNRLSVFHLVEKDALNLVGRRIGNACSHWTNDGALSFFGDNDRPECGSVWPRRFCRTEPEIQVPAARSHCMNLAERC